MDDTLLRQAQARGIETSFVDFDGVERSADEPTLRLLLNMLARTGDGEDVLVVRDGDAIDLGGLDGHTDGKGSRITAVLRRHDHVIARSRAPQLTLPDDLPRGNYRLELALEGGAKKIFQLLHTPARAYQPPFALQGGRSWVLSVQLYSLCNARNFGHGDFTDLLQLLKLVADTGGGGIGVNPLHALNEADPDEASPYAPSSRIFLNWLYIDVGNLPGIDADEFDRLRPRQSRDDGLMDYEGVAAAKEKMLRLCYRRLLENGDEQERRAFTAFRDEMGEDLRRYAAFCFLRKREGSPWRFWRRPWAQPSAQDIAQLAQEEVDEIGFHEFVQFQAHRQLARCAQFARQRQMDIGLYLDVAVGVHPDGFDAWNDPDAFLQGASIGAPPDALNKAGQNWGLAGFHPGALRRKAYAPFRKMLSACMRHAGAIRIDHVLGLNRLYIIPPGSEPTQGVYVKYPLRDLLAVAALESQFNRCLIIGEDLGTVPAGLREQLREHGIWAYRVVIFERGEAGFLPPETYPQAALATFTTHDLPTFAGWIAGEDIKLAHGLGLATGETGAMRAAAVLDFTRLATGTAAEAALEFKDIVAFLGRTPSHLVAFALEDLLGSSVQVNLPGTHREYPNWRHRLEFDHSRIAACLRQLAMALTRGKSGSIEAP